jgi:hypothetical protein
MLGHQRNNQGGGAQNIAAKAYPLGVAPTHAGVQQIPAVDLLLPLCYLQQGRVVGETDHRLVAEAEAYTRV